MDLNLIKILEFLKFKWMGIKFQVLGFMKLIDYIKS
jgi:hypothetical protein